MLPENEIIEKIKSYGVEVERVDMPTFLVGEEEWKVAHIIWCSDLQTPLQFFEPFEEKLKGSNKLYLLSVIQVENRLAIRGYFRRR